jgi:peptidoglycan/xylan/chitin deacetylase (PgdA/CDA1 family)
VRLPSLTAAGLQVVLYHHLADEPSGLARELTHELRVATPPALFEAHLRRLARDYDVVDLDQVLSGRLPRRPLLITFDDGYRSVLDVGGPILRRLGLPSVFFVSAAFVAPGSLPLDNLLCRLAQQVGAEAVEQAVTGRPGTARTVDALLGLVATLPYARRARLGDELAERFGVDRAQLRRESGLFLEHTELPRLAEFACEVGNHTSSHLFCRAIADEAAGEVELVEHKGRLELWAGTRIRAFSYPYGRRRDATPLVERLLAESGHEATFLVESRPNTRRRAGATWNRVSVQDRPVARLGIELEVLPRLRALRDRVAPISAAR